MLAVAGEEKMPAPMAEHAEDISLVILYIILLLMPFSRGILFSRHSKFQARAAAMRAAAPLAICSAHVYCVEMRPRAGTQQSRRFG